MLFTSAMPSQQPTAEAKATVRGGPSNRAWKLKQPYADDHAIGRCGRINHMRRQK